MKIITPLLIMALVAPVYAGSKDDPLLTSITFDALEWRDAGSEESLNWDVEAWIGKDLHKLWMKAEGEREQGVTTETEWQLLYNRAVTPFWDLQLGFRFDAKPEPSRDWLVLGLQGVAPYFVETEASLFIGEGGQTGLRLNLEYELLMTQRWVLVPEFELNAHTRNDRQTHTGSGLSELELGLRLHYEISREVAPYVGVSWAKQYGNTADFSRAAGEETQDNAVVLGLKLTF